MATAFVNKHIARVMLAGGTVAEPAWLAQVDNWISGQNLYGHLMDWSNPAIGVIKDGSNHISKIMGLGTTWLGRLGDLTPINSTNTTYDATGISSKPCWTNSTGSDYSYYGASRSGSLRWNQMRRKHYAGFSVICVYKKTHTNKVTPIGYGQFGGISLSNASGSPGAVNFQCNPAGVNSPTAAGPVTVSNSVVNIIGGTFDQGTKSAICYVEGVGGTPQTGGNAYRPCLGGANFNEQQYCHFLSGSTTTQISSSSTTLVPSVSSSDAEAQMSISDLILFYTALSSAQMTSLNTLLRTRY